MPARSEVVRSRLRVATVRITPCARGRVKWLRINLRPDRHSYIQSSSRRNQTMSSAEVRFKDLRADFGKTASDYGRHRAGFPDEFFERLAALGILKAGMCALDLGTGTGTIWRGLALRGCNVTGLDRSAPLMEQAAEIDRAAGVVVKYVNAAAEDTGLTATEFDLVSAGQCWH